MDDYRVLLRRIEVLERDLASLKRSVPNLPTRTAKTGGTGKADPTKKWRTVKTLPPIPNESWDVVFWTKQDGGTGDDQLWFAAKGYTKWIPWVDITSKKGDPGTQ